MRVQVEKMFLRRIKGTIEALELQFRQNRGHTQPFGTDAAIQQVRKTQSNLMGVFALGHGLAFPSLGPGC